MFPIFFMVIIYYTIQFLFNHCKKKKEIPVGEDRISKLPDNVLSSIISFLPTDEALRTSVLSKHWKNLWKYASHLDFNQNSMLDSAFEQWLKVYTDINIPEHKAYAACYELLLQFENSIKSIKKVLMHHWGELERCTIVHIKDSCINGDVVGLTRYLVDVKRVHELDLECSYVQCWDMVRYFKNFMGDAMIPIPISILIPPTLNICFHVLATSFVLILKNYVLKNSPPLRICENLKTLKLNKVWLSDQLFDGIILKCVSLEHLSLVGCKQLKRIRIQSPHIKSLEIREMTLYMINVVAMNLEVMDFDTVVTQWKGLVIDAPNLKVLRVSYRNPTARGMPKLRFQRVLLTTKVILEKLTNPVTPEGSVPPNMLANLVTLYIDLDLNGGRDINALYAALKSCDSLEELEINNKDFYNSKNSSPPDSKFWEIRESCIGIFEKLKTVRIRGIKGKVLEMEFIKFVTKKAKMVTSMTLFFVSDDARNILTSDTFLVERTTNDLRITLITGQLRVMH